MRLLGQIGKLKVLRKLVIFFKNFLKGFFAQETSTKNLNPGFENIKKSNTKKVGFFAV